MKLVIPWLKVFVDSDTRYSQFLCPGLPDPSSVSGYQAKCPYVPSGGGGPTPSVAIVGLLVHRRGRRRGPAHGHRCQQPAADDY
jgi:hypothetical protein